MAEARNERLMRKKRKGKRESESNGGKTRRMEKCKGAGMRWEGGRDEKGKSWREGNLRVTEERHEDWSRKKEGMIGGEGGRGGEGGD